MANEKKSLIDSWRDKGLISEEAFSLCNRFVISYQISKRENRQSPGFSEYVEGSGDRDMVHVRTIHYIKSVDKFRTIMGPYYMMMEKLFVHGYTINQYFIERDIRRGRQRNQLLDAFRNLLNTKLVDEWYRVS